MKQRRWIWVGLFIIAVVTLGLLATGWNVKVVEEYRRFIENRKPLDPSTAFGGWFSALWGSIGFLATLTALVLFFVRLLREMRLSQQQSEFLAAVTHELKTPLAAIELSASLIRSGGLKPEEERKLWESHSRELERLREQIGLLLEAARWQGGAPRPEKQRFRLEDWMAAQWPRWEESLGPGSRLERKGLPLDCAVELDPRMLTLIVQTLMDNSRKFARDRAHVTVHTSLEPRLGSRPAAWQIVFEDDGWGFPKEDSERIFMRFVRANSGSPFAVSGTGLGLYIAASATRALGLKLRAESKPGRLGALFYLEGTEAG